jgi:glycosyltransferase involved in cell wall biosynthesis
MDEVELDPRICMVLKRPLGTSGLQLQARNVIARLRAQGTECSVVVHARTASGAAAVRDWAVPVTVLRARSNALFHLKLGLHLCRTRRRYDVIHVHGCGPEALSAAIGGALAGGKPVVVKPSTAGPGTRLGTWAAGGARSPWAAWLLRRGVWRWIAISERTLRDLRQAGVPEERIVSIPNGVETRRYQPLPAEQRSELRAAFGVGPGEVVAGAVARLTPHKRIDLLIHAAGDLREQLPWLRIWIIGTGEERKRLEALAGERACVGVEFLDQLSPEEVCRRLQACDVYVACSRWEGLSNALLEAMACGLAPIATRVSGTEDLIMDRESGIVVEPDDQEGLKAALRELASDPVRREQMGAAARATVCASYGLPETAERLQNLYRLALRPAARPRVRVRRSADRSPGRMRG